MLPVQSNLCNFGICGCYIWLLGRTVLVLKFSYIKLKIPNLKLRDRSISVFK